MRHARLILLAASAAAACAEQVNTEARREDAAGAPTRIGSLATPEWEGRLAYVERHTAGPRPLRTVAMRAGGGQAALLQESPSRTYLIELAASASLPVMGGPNGREQRTENPPRGYPTDVVAMTPDGQAWLLDGGTGRVISEDVGGNRRVVAALGGNGVARSGCVAAGGALLFIGDARPETVFVRPLGQAADTRALPLPSGTVEQRRAAGDSLRFAGAPNGPCVLWGPRLQTVLLVSESAVRPLGPFVERAPMERWYRSWWRRLRQAPEPRWVSDATSFPGIVALLFAGRTAGAERMVDLYAEDGAYLETMVLPHRTLRIAGDGERLYAVRQDRDSVLLASYVLPWSVRARIRAARPAEARTPGAPRGPQGARRVRGGWLPEPERTTPAR